MRIFVAGHKGMVGRAILRNLEDSNHTIITKDKSDLDLLDQASVNTFFKNNKIDQVYLAAAKVGGIFSNNNLPAQFIYENLVIQSNVINSAHESDVNKLLFLGSSCIYPKFSSQPISEDLLLTGVLEETNEPYAIAKIAGIKLCESYCRQYGRDYRSVMPTNLYGPNDNFHLENSHVIPAMIRRFHEAKELKSEQVTVWGTGNPKREFLHVDDMALGCIHVMNIDRTEFIKTTNDISHLNIGTGVDCTIKELANLIAECVGFSGEIVFDTKKPDGTPRKLLNVEKINSLGWSHSISLEYGLKHTYDWYLNNINNFKSK